MPSVEHRLSPDSRATIFARIFEPTSAAHGLVVMPSAMGVAQSFYGPFAAWLTEQGFVVVTFDYRGIGASAPASLRGFNANIFDWAKDCAAVIDFVTTRYPRLPLNWIGHSLGGQLLGLIANRDRIERVVTIGTGNGYWLENSWPTKRVAWALWYLIVPVVLPLCGYFPGKRLRIVGELPRGVMAQWRRWCLDREYMVGVEGEAVRDAYARFNLPITALSFTDDEMMSDASIRSLHALYKSASIEYCRMAPSEVGAQHIGHFGFFREKFEPTLWVLVRGWLVNRPGQDSE